MSSSKSPARQIGTGRRPFLGIIDAVVVELPPTDYRFEGAITEDHANAAWSWMVADVAPDLLADEVAAEDVTAQSIGLDGKIPEILARIRKKIAEAEANAELGRKLRSRLGGAAAWDRLPFVMEALRCWPLLEKAEAFGRSISEKNDEAALAQVLQAMPLHDQGGAAFVMQAAMRHIAVPSKLMRAAIRSAGSANEDALRRAGFAPLVGAVLSHAQDQIRVVGQSGRFVDMDRVCTSVDRFHQLIRALTTLIELQRGDLWARTTAGLINAISDRLLPKLQDIAPDMNMALRRRDTNDRVDSDQILAALNGIYLLATVRDARSSLAVNALFDQVWAQTGQALEIHLDRQLDYLRADPNNAVAEERFDAAVKMAEVRFSLDYAGTMRHAKEVAMNRGSISAAS